MRLPTALLALQLTLAVFAQAQDAARDFVRGPAEALPEPIAAAVAAVRAPALAAHVAFLASPALEGRGLGSRGLDAAQEYVAAQLALAGLKPLAAACGDCGGAATYAQDVPLREVADRSGTLTLTAVNGSTTRSRTFSAGVDLLLPDVAVAALSAPVMFTGYGIRERPLGYDDYRGLDVRGAVVVALAGVPAGPEWQARELHDRWAAADEDERYRSRVEAARAAGAVALVVVELDEWSARAAAPDAQSDRVFAALAGGEAELLLLRASPAVAAFVAAALEAQGPLAAEHPRAVAGLTAAIAVGGAESVLTSRNLVAVLPGADPRLRERAVVLGAHLDHLGTRGGAVLPGADDNASGVAALLEIARAVATGEWRPRRTLVLAFWTGEEEGKLGSGHWVRHPLWPLERTDAYVNLDMIGHPWLAEEARALVEGAHLENGLAFLDGLDTADLVEVGLPSGEGALADAVRRAARGTGLALHLDRTDGRNGGSDYRDFARAGVPFLRFFGNYFPAYHEPGDTPAGVDPLQVQRVARVSLATALLLADGEP